MKSSDSFAIAFDIGTTTIAASLIDVVSGERLAHAGALNPQREFGSDVVLRLQAACEAEAKLRTLSRLINDELQRLTRDLLGRTGTNLHNLRGIAMAGNPAMEHLLLGLPVQSLAFPPHRPLFKDGKVISTSRLGWQIETNAYLFPLPGGFVGGDLVAFLYGVISGDTPGDSERARYASPLLCLDLGTNAEIALVAEDRILATSAAAGPAFEAGNLACGMAALPGAITGVKITGDKVVLAKIGADAPAGICGSGVISAVSGLIEAGVIDCSGRLLSPMEIATNLGNRIVEVNGDRVFVMYKDAGRLVYLSQQDIRQVQMAKAAVRAGMEVLFSRAGVAADEVKTVVLTGSFGAELAAGDLKSIGILNEKMVNITGFIREGVLSGVERALCSGGDFTGIDRFAERVRVVPLSGTPVFEKLFIEQMDFPERCRNFME